MSAQQFRVNVVGKGEKVVLQIITPDGEPMECGTVYDASHVLPMAMQMSALLSGMIVQAIYEARA